MKKTLKVLTYNIHKGFSLGNTRFVLENIKAALTQIEVDVVFLQEVQGEHRRNKKKISNWPTVGQFEYLADGIFPHFAYGKNAIYQDGHHGNAILSRYPFQTWENISLTKMKSASRSVLHGTLSIELAPESTPMNLHLLCIHLGLFEGERKRQMHHISKRIQEHVPPGEPIIMAGDFNDWRVKAPFHSDQHLGLKEAFLEKKGTLAKTFPSPFPLLPVDRIYYRSLSLLESRTLEGPPWSNLSDHIPLYSEFDLVHTGT